MKTHRPKLPWEVYELAERYVENAPIFLRWIGKNYLINLFYQAYYRGKKIGMISMLIRYCLTSNTKTKYANQ